MPHAQAHTVALDAMVDRAEGLLLGRGAPRDARGGMTLLYQAAAEGSGAALARLAALAATGPDIRKTLPQAVDLLRRAADLGEPAAQQQLCLLAGVGNLHRVPRVDWSGICQAVSPAPWLALPNRIEHLQTPHVFTLQNLLPPGVCDWLIGRARPGLKPALMQYGYGDAATSATARTGGAFEVDIVNADVVLGLVRARIGHVLSTPVQHFEAPQILHYAVNQEFRPHYDLLQPSDEAGAYQGLRAVTCLVYLNQGYAGGETVFPRADFSFAGKTGDALCFSNLDAGGKPERLSLHAGLPVQAGEKWMLSQWIHDRPYA